MENKTTLLDETIHETFHEKKSIVSKRKEKRRNARKHKACKAFHAFKNAIKYILFLHFTSKCVPDDPKPQCLSILHIDYKSRPFLTAAKYPPETVIRSAHNPDNI